MTLTPNDPHPHMMYAHQCSFHGRHEEALQQAHKALHLAPVDSMVNFRLVQCFYFARRYDDTIRSARTTIEVAPEFANTYTYLARALVETSQPEEAWNVASKARALGMGHPIIEGMYGYLAGVTRHKEQAVEVLRGLEVRRRAGYYPALPLAWTHLGLGNAEAYLDQLELAFEEREPFLASAHVFPGSDCVRGDRRFAGICRRLGFTA
jgi:tetratricopeptide (TPR) repeat protein